MVRVRFLSWTAGLASVLAAVGIGAVASPAHAQVRCGDVIGPKQSVTLRANLESCPLGAAALTVIEPATLDLNGFSIICQDAGDETPFGIVVDGRRATVRNGTVQRCASGVRVRGKGSHRIENVVAALSGGRFLRHGEGFVVESDGNRLTGNSAVQNEDDGFIIMGAERNRLIRNFSFFNESGFKVFVGERNVLQENVANENELGGFVFVAGSGRNTAKGNFARANPFGFFMDGATSSRFSGNVANANADGMFLTNGRSNRLVGNSASDNDKRGIVLLSEKGMQVTRNTALNNGRDEPAHVDLVDSDQQCIDNRWRRNVFGTTTSPCVR